MAKKKKVSTGKVDDPLTADVDESVDLGEAEEIPEPDPDPATQVAIHNGGDSYTIVDAPMNDFGQPDIRNRHLRMYDKTFEHTGEYKGVWAYRHLG